MDWMLRRDTHMPRQNWKPFPCDAIVQIKNAYGDTKIGPAHSFWWGYEEESGGIGESVITQARRLDKPHDPS